MIKKWISVNERDENKYSFKVFDVTQKSDLNDNIKEYVGKEILDAYRNVGQLKRHYKNETREKLVEYLNQTVFPNLVEEISNGEKGIRKNVRQGDFGEIITTKIIEHLKDMYVPMYKLHWKFNNNRSVFCTDIFAHNQGDDIKELRYYEVKTRITNQKKKLKDSDEKSYYIGALAYFSLYKDEGAESTEGIADYLQRYYYELAESLSNDGLEEQALRYYAASLQYSDIVKNKSKYNRSFEIVLIMEKNVFKEEILSELDDLPPQLNPLEVTVFLVDNLRSLIEESYDKALDYACKHVYGEDDNENEQSGVL